MSEPQPESFEVDEEDGVAANSRERFEGMGFEPIEAMMLVHAGAHPTEVEKTLKRGCPRHVALEIYT